MMTVVGMIVFLVRLALLGLPIYLIYCDHMLLGLAALVASYPLWEVLIYHIQLRIYQVRMRPFRPNWRKARPGNCYNYSSHNFTLISWHNPGLNLSDVYKRLRYFEDFNGKNNRFARQRGKMIQGVQYVYFESLGFFGLLSLLVNSPSSPVRVWSCKTDRGWRGA